MDAPHAPGPAHAHGAERRIGVGFQPCNQIDQSVRRQAASSDEHLRRGRQQRYRLKVVDEVERQRVGRSAEDMTIEMADAERIAVGLRANRAATAWVQKRCRDYQRSLKTRQSKVKCGWWIAPGLRSGCFSSDDVGIAG